MQTANFKIELNSRETLVYTMEVVDDQVIGYNLGALFLTPTAMEALLTAYEDYKKLAEKIGYTVKP